MGKKQSAFADTTPPQIYENINSDELKTIPKMIKAAKVHLTAGKSVIFDRTNPKKEKRAEFIELSKKYNVPVRCVVLTTSFEDAREWNIKRLNETGKKVPDIAFYTFRKYYEPPCKDEGYSEIVEI